MILFHWENEKKKNLAQNNNNTNEKELGKKYDTVAKLLWCINDWTELAEVSHEFVWLFWCVASTAQYLINFNNYVINSPFLLIYFTQFFHPFKHLLNLFENFFRNLVKFSSFICVRKHRVSLLTKNQAKNGGRKWMCLRELEVGLYECVLHSIGDMFHI